MVRAWYVVGKPKAKIKPLGSFERWSIAHGPGLAMKLYTHLGLAPKHVTSRRIRQLIAAVQN
jgi:hypothetical protein